jgi:uncharacterized membrane protein
MSLKIFHIVFVSMACLVSLGFGVWGWQNQAAPVLVVGAFVTAVGLLVYGILFYGKIKDLK